MRNVDHRIFRRHLPELHAQSGVRGRVRTRRGRGRALVVPRVRATARSGRTRAARDRRRARSPGRRWKRTTGSRASSRRSARSGLLAPLRADVALLHAPIADRAGNVALHPPLLEGVWGALGARRGAIVTVERIVDDIRPWSHLVRIPAHRVLAVVECPMGAHPGGLLRRHAARRRVRRGLRILGRCPGRDPRPTTTTRGSSSGCSTSRRRTSGSRSSAPNGSRRCARRPRPTRGTPTKRRTSPTSTRRSNAWETRRGVGRALSRRARARDRRRRGARGRGRRQPLGVARRAARARTRIERAAHRGDRAVGLRRDTRRSVRAEPPQLPDRDDAQRRDHGAGRAGRWRGHDDDRLSRRRADRPLRQRQLDAHRAAPVPRRLGRGQRRREHRDRERRRRDAHAAANAGRLLVHHVARVARCARS